MTENPDLPSNEITPEPVTAIEKQPGKWKDFWIGFIGSIAVNIILSFLINGFNTLISSTLLKDYGKSPIYWIMLALPWILNILAIILLLVFKRPRIVLGTLASYAIPIVIALCFVAFCFVTGQSL